MNYYGYLKMNWYISDALVSNEKKNTQTTYRTNLKQIIS